MNAFSPEHNSIIIKGIFSKKKKKSEKIIDFFYNYYLERKSGVCEESEKKVRTQTVDE